jgi:predicted deacylase
VRERTERAGGREERDHDETATILHLTTTRPQRTYDTHSQHDTVSREMLPYLATGNPRGPTVVLVSGFPDDEISGTSPYLSFLSI